MSLTVKECLKLSPLDRFNVLTNDIGLKRPVTMVSILDAVDSVYWFKGGELTMTNAFAFKDQPQKLVEILPILADRGVAALAIKVNRFLFTLPDGLLEQAMKCGLPLLRMPDDCSYCDVLAPLYNEIYFRNLAAKTRAINNAFQDCIATGMGLCGLTDILSRRIGFTVLVADNSDCILASSGKLSTSIELGPGSSLQRVFECLGTMKVFRYSLARTAQKYGSLIIVGTNERLPRQAEEIIEHSLVVFTLEMIRETQDREVAACDFLYSVLIGKMRDHETILKKMVQYKLNYFSKYFCILIFLHELQDVYNTEDELLVKPNLQPAQDQLEKTLAKGFRGENIETLIFNGAHGIVILCPSDKKGNSQASLKEAMALVSKTAENCNFGVPGLQISMGVSSACRELPKCNGAYDEALKALKIGMKITGVGSVTHFGDLGLYRIMTTIDNKDELEGLYRHSIGKLVEYDLHNGTTFLVSLQVYCESNFNIKKTAEKLHLHYNSLQYRLKKISEITGIDLGSSEGIFQLMIGLKIKQIL